MDVQPPFSSRDPAGRDTVDVDRHDATENSEDDDGYERSKDGGDVKTEALRVKLALKAQQIQQDIIEAKRRYEYKERSIKKALEHNAMKYKVRQTYLNSKLRIIEDLYKESMEELNRWGREDHSRLTRERAKRDEASTERLEQMICNLYFQPLDSSDTAQLKLQRLEEDQRVTRTYEDSHYEKLSSDDEVRRRRIWEEVKSKIDNDPSVDIKSSEDIAFNDGIWSALSSREDGGWMRFVSRDARQYYCSIYETFEHYERRFPCDHNDRHINSSSYTPPFVKKLKRRPVSKETADRIRQDARRTFSNFGQHSQAIAFLINRREPQCIEALSNLLLNSAQYFGYCQGMNYIGANFLCYHTEMDAFILFCYLMHDKNLRVLFDPNSACLVLYIRELEHWLECHHRELYCHLKNIGFTGYCYAIQWFNTCYISSNPGNLSRCVIDILLIDVRDALLRVGVSILGNIENQLMHLDVESTQRRFKTCVAGVRTVDVLYRALTMTAPPGPHHTSSSFSLDLKYDLLRLLDPKTCTFEDETKEQGGESNEKNSESTSSRNGFNNDFASNYDNHRITKGSDCQDDTKMYIEDCNYVNHQKLVNNVNMDTAERARAHFEEELDRLYEKQNKDKANENANRYLRQLLVDSNNQHTSKNVMEGGSSSSSKITCATGGFSIQSTEGCALSLVLDEEKFEAIKKFDKGYSRAMILIERLILGVIARKRYVTTSWTILIFM